MVKCGLLLYEGRIFIAQNGRKIYNAAIDKTYSRMMFLSISTRIAG